MKKVNRRGIDVLNKKGISVLAIGVVLFLVLVSAIPVMAAGEITAMRDISNQAVNPGDTFTVTVTITANQEIEALALDEDIPSGWEVTRVSDDAAAFKESTIEWIWTEKLSAGDSKTVIYNVTVPSDAEEGTYYITGKVSAYKVNPIAVGGETEVNVTLPPIANFTYTPEKPVVNQPVTFNASLSYDPDGGEITEYWWNVSGTIYTTQKFNHTFTNPGEKYVFLQVKDDEGDTNSTVKWINITPSNLSVIFEDDFSELNLNTWIPFGSPSPRVLASVEGRNGVFDNNGDSWCNSGVVSKKNFSFPNGFTMESDMFLRVTDVTGCWDDAIIGITRQNTPTGESPCPTESYPLGVYTGIFYTGDACWATPVEKRRHAYFRAALYAEDGTSESVGYNLSADDYINGWHSYKIVVGSDRYVKFYVDGDLIYASKKKLHPDVLNKKKIFLGVRSSGSAGKSYHDFIKVYAPSSNISTVSFNPPKIKIPPNSTNTINITLDSAPNGLSGYNISLSLSNGSIAEITSVEFLAWAGLHSNSTLPADSLWIKAVDLNDKIKSGATNITLATITLRGDKQGISDILITVTKMDDDNGNPIDPNTVSGKVEVIGVVPFPGCENPPTDPDNDGLYEDINGNGRKGFNDVVVFFNYLKWVEENQPCIECFDFNKNGRIDFDDVVKLFEEI